MTGNQQKPSPQKGRGTEKELAGGVVMSLRGPKRRTLVSVCGEWSHFPTLPSLPCSLIYMFGESADRERNPNVHLI